MSSPSNEFIDALAALQTRLKDTLAGFDEIQQKADPEIAGITAEFIATHTAHELALSQRLVTLGREPDEDGSFFSTIQRLVIKTRAAFDNIDDDILPSVVRGEERVIDLYDDAFNNAADDTDKTMLHEQRAEVRTLTEKARVMGD